MSLESEGSAVDNSKAQRPLRPVLIVSRRTINDYPSIFRKMLVGLSDQPLPVAVVCPPECGSDIIMSGATEVIRYPFYNTPVLFLQNYNILLEKLEEFEASVLHCLCTSKAHLTRKLSRHLSIPYVLAVNSLQKHFRLFVSSRRCARIIVPAESIAANITKLFPRLADRVEMINIGTFTEETICCFKDSSRFVSMVTDSLFQNADNFESLLGAVRHLAIDGYEFLLVIISNGGRQERQLRKLINALGLTQDVIIVPRFESWRSILSASDIFIQPQPMDSFNPLLLEAMSMGAAVAGCKGGVDDLIIEDKTAFIFDPDDELSIYATLQRMLDARGNTRKLARNAQDYVREHHSVSRMISQLLDCYQADIRLFNGF
ncbi:MAG: glycosyltransferase family 4 protein [Planctomycetota bacterium]|jgi:glycosyltransferase involved in cell wall biosynthesis